MYPMTINFSKKGYTITDGDHSRTLKCPMNRMNQWNREYYNFSKDMKVKHLVSYFKYTKGAKTHSGLAKRLWDVFWEEGWRETQK